MVNIRVVAKNRFVLQTTKIKAIILGLLSLVLLGGSACTDVNVRVRVPSTLASPLTGKNCKLQRELKNQYQQTSVWCWAATAHTVIEYLKNERIKQCDLLQALYRGQLEYEWNKPGRPGALEPPHCCMKMPEEELPPKQENTAVAQQVCFQNGWPESIFFTEEFATRFEGWEYDWTIPYPHGLSWNEIVSEICEDRPMISAILYAPEIGGGAHTVVIGGYNEMEDGSQWVHVYDPGFNTMEEDYYLWPYDVYLGDPGVFTHVRDYKNISLR